MEFSNVKRRKYLIDNRQYRFIVGGLVYFGAVIFVFAGVVFGPVIIQLQSGSTSSPEVQQAGREFLILHTRLWAPLFFLLVLLMWHSMRASHRIVGPLYRIRSVLKAVAEGKLTERVNLRKRDYLIKEADSVNAMVDSLKEKLDVLRREHRGANEALDNLRRATHEGSMEEMHTRMNELTSHLDVLKARLNDFDTGDTPETESAKEETVLSC